MNGNQRRPRVLVCDRISDSGIELLREHADVDVQTGLKPDELLKIVADYEALVVRSATKITANIIDQSLLEKNKRLRRFVLGNLGTSEARYYAEPVYLMDE